MLAGKRILGYLSWNLRRRRVHVAPVLQRLTDDVKAQRPDHVAVTGDITNISLPAEFDQAATWLQRLGPAEQVSVIPGNHDAYVQLPWPDSLGKWADYMGGVRTRAADETEAAATGRSTDAAERAAEGPGDFPYLRRRGPLAVVGVSTACPTMPFSAAGALGAAQLERLRSLLRSLAGEGLCRVVLIHHPPLPGGASRRKQLRDSLGFREVIASEGADLILHGHTHRSSLAHIDGPDGARVPVIGVAAASAGAQFKGKGLAEYCLYRIDGGPGQGWRMEVEVRAIDPGLEGFATKSRFSLDLPQERPRR
jgi:3',5'-cyclic AMP phosphodiesterase CpdA